MTEARREAHGLGHPGPKAVFRAFHNESAVDEVLKKFLWVFTRFRPLNEREDLVFAKGAVDHTPGKQWQLVTFELVEDLRQFN